MKKGKFLVVGLLVLLMVGGLVIMGCAAHWTCSRSGACYMNNSYLGAYSRSDTKDCSNDCAYDYYLSHTNGLSFYCDCL
jgi:hypothetical protein